MPPKNKKYLAQKEKEDRQKKIIIITTITILVLVFGLIIYGVLDRYVFSPRKAVISLQGETIRANEFEEQARWIRRSKIMQLSQILSTIQQLGGTHEVYNYFQQDVETTVTALQQPLLAGQEVLQALTEDLIIRVEAKKMGISISNDEIDQAIQEAFGYYPNGTPTPIASATPEATVELDTESTPQAEGEGGAPDPTATPLLQPTEYTEELFQSNYQDFLADIKNDGISESTVRDIVEISLLRQAVYDEVTAGVSQIQEQVHVRHILVDDEETAQEVLQKLNDGEDFADLASEYSTDTSNKDKGGDLGWFGRGSMVQEFEDAAFALNVGEISDPVQTDYGWHILELLGKEDRPLSDTAYQQLQGQVWDQWLSDRKDEYQADLKVNDNWTKYVPSEPSIPADFLNYIATLSQQQPALPTDIPLPSVTPQE